MRLVTRYRFRFIFKRDVYIHLDLYAGPLCEILCAELRLEKAKEEGRRQEGGLMLAALLHGTMQRNTTTAVSRSACRRVSVRACCNCSWCVCV